MGMAASQARFLGLTARKSNNEYQAQQINQQRLDLASQQEEIARNYNEKTNNRMFCFDLDGDTSTLNPQLSYWDIVNPRFPTDEDVALGITAGMGYRLVDANGNVIAPNYPKVDTDDEKIAAIIEKYEVNEDVSDNTKLQENLENKTWVIRARRKGDDGIFQEIPFDIDPSKNEATFITRMRSENPKDSSDREYWRLYNTLAPKVGNYYQELSYLNLTTLDDLEIEIYNTATNKVVVPEMSEEDMAIVYGRYKIDPNCIDKTYLEEKLRNGEWFIQQPSVSSDTDWSESKYWNAISEIRDEYNLEDDAAAKTEYTYLMAKFQKQDKLLEMRLKEIETEHKALETELDSISQVIKDNIDKSFKTFA